MGRLAAWVLLFLIGFVVLEVSAQEQKPGEQAPAAGQPAAQTLENQNRSPEPRTDNSDSAKPASATAPQPAAGGFPLDKFQEFSAIQTGEILPGSDWDGYIYRSGKLMRLQRNTKAPSYFITDLETRQSHGLAASGCLKLGMPTTRSFPFFLSGPGYKYERTPVGEETVDGHLCRVEDIAVNAPKNPIQLKMRLWEAEDLQGFPIKIENRRQPAQPWTIHYKNVVLGPQDPTLFIVPDQCQTTAGMKPSKSGSATAKPKAAPAEKK